MRIWLPAAVMLVMTTGCRASSEAEVVIEKSTAPAQLVPKTCKAATERPAVVDLMAATYGDLTGFVPPGLVPIPPEIIARVQGHDVEVHTVGVTPAHVVSDAGALERPLAGLTPEHLARLQPWLAQGRLPKTNAAELLMTRGDARALGVVLGEVLRVATADDTQRVTGKLSMTLVGLLEVPEFIDTGGAATVWTEASQVTEPPSVSLAAFVKDSRGVDAARSKLESSVDFHWSTAPQMQAPLLEFTAELTSLCAQRPSSATTALPWAEPVLPCSALSRWDEDTNLLRSFMGDAIATHLEFQSAERWPTTSPEGAIVPIATYQSVAMFKDRLFGMETTAVPGSTLRRLESMVVEGNLEGVTATDGIVLSRAVTDSLGLGLGDRVHIGLSAGTRLLHDYGVVQLRVAAIVELPGRPAGGSLGSNDVDPSRPGPRRCGPGRTCERTPGHRRAPGLHRNRAVPTHRRRLGSPPRRTTSKHPAAAVRRLNATPFPHHAWARLGEMKALRRNELGKEASASAQKRRFHPGRSPHGAPASGPGSAGKPRRRWGRFGRAGSSRRADAAKHRAAVCRGRAWWWPPA